jgi:golgi apparatus protein 1
VQTCSDERNVFCGDVATGQARVFRCLVHNLGKADFGDACKNEILSKLQRRQENWKLDISLRAACKDDAAEHCADVDHDADHAEVARCLIRKHDDLIDACLHEVRSSL